ncbi:MAG: AAA family ATPase [Armatimonadetes bacterium]|nr:AAA family ATPase [Armatimonadota bacterium]HOM82277.1 ATP-binding protein [Armatimonadota bacterium]HPO73745.1 ATP-binding protein [Armatimonadota bacterium]
MLRDLLNWGPRRDLVELIVPRKTFSDVILPEKTRRALADTLVQIEKHHLIFDTWGLGERHSTGTGLVFNFAGPPGTGKTICAEAVANLLGKRLYRIRYSELESCWAGETGKNIAAVFREARQQDAVLLFDEADSIASRRFTTMSYGYEREANQAVNVLLKELEDYDGVVIFATNLCANFDPAFERRVRTHILFEMPGARERELIWKVQIHPQRTPLAEDVDFRALAEAYALSGGDIKNAVLKAAQMAAGEEGPDHRKRIHQRHFEAAVQEVLEAKRVMDQSLFGEVDLNGPASAVVTAAFQEVESRITELEKEAEAIPPQIATIRQEVSIVLEGFSARVEGIQEEHAARIAEVKRQLEETRQSMEAQLQALSAQWSERLKRVTLVPLPRWQAYLVGGLGMVAAAAAGAAAKAFGLF